MENKSKTLTISESLLAYWLSRSDFFRNVLALMTGTAIAQTIPIAASPILTRLYAPEDFGVLALYMSVAAIISVIVTGRYELAVILPKSDEDAINVAAICIIIASLVSLVTFIVIWVFNTKITSLLGNPKISKWLYFVPLTISLTGILHVLISWCIRKKHFKRLSINKIYGSSSSSAAKIGVGFAGAGETGLITGGILGLITATGILGWQVCRNDNIKRKTIKRNKITSLLVRYKNFPKFSIPADFINVIANQMPVILFSNFFGAAVVGFYAFTHRILGMPLGLISNSILDVFKQRASSDYATYGNCRDIYVKTLKHMLLISVIPFTLFYFIAPELFAFVFGTQWRQAGEYAQLLSILFLFRFIASPLSYVLYIAEKQKYDLIWQVFLLIFTFLSILIGVYLNNAKISLTCFSLSYSAMYLISLYISYYFAKGNSKYPPKTAPERPAGGKTA